MHGTRNAEARRRRTQAERSAEMQGRVLDAALDCLVDFGYAGTTTTVVAERAGVSRGAQLHHFPTRTALVAAAVERLFAALTVEFRGAFAALAGAGDRVGGAVDLLWSMFAKPRYAAVLELQTAARSDAELRAHLAPIAARHQQNVSDLARDYFPEAAGREDFAATLQLLLDAMAGMAAARLLYGELTDEQRRLGRLRSLAATVVAASPAPREE
jgi:AcrR family transcriptional regulator